MSRLYEFVVVGGMLAVTPGPNMVYVMSRSIAQGPRAGLLSLAGVMTGYFTYMFSAAFGITALFFAVPWAGRLLAGGGALYLLSLAWKAARPGGKSPFEITRQPDAPPRKLFAMGAATSLLNPKLALTFVSLLPQFIDHQAGSVFRQSIALGASLVVAFAAVNGCVAIGSGSLATFLASRPRWLTAQRWLMGAMLFTLGIKMALETLSWPH